MKISALPPRVEATSRAPRYDAQIDPTLHSFRELLRLARKAAERAREVEGRSESPAEGSPREIPPPVEDASARTTRTWIA